MSSFYFYLILFFYGFSPLKAQKQIRISSFSSSNSPWKPTQIQTLFSPNSTFAAGFRRLPRSTNQFVFAIWYEIAAEKNVVWTFRGGSPVGRDASLLVSATGELRLIYGAISEKIASGSNSTELVLGENGTLTFGDWFSYLNLSDTILPGQVIQANDTVIRSRINPYTFAPGPFEFRNGLGLVFNGTDVYNNVKNFVNLTFDGRIVMQNRDPLMTSDMGAILHRRLTLDPDGNLRIYSLDLQSGTWSVVWQAVQEICTIHGICGENFFCLDDNSNRTLCNCPPGYAKTGGLCQIKKKIQNPQSSKFLRLDYVNFIGGLNDTNIIVPNFDACQNRCLKNPKCLAFKFQFNDKNRNCVPIERLLYGYWSPSVEFVTFLRVDQSETDTSNFNAMTKLLDTVCPVNISLPDPPNELKSATRNLAVIFSLFAVELIIGVASFICFLRRFRQYRDMARAFGFEQFPAGGPKRFTYAELKVATNNFSTAVGEGAFGVVFSGQLSDGRKVAVKRLKFSDRGEAEFWGEVTIIARMHHLNLVRLWGFCAEKNQRLLVYEFISNGSLASHLFHRHCIEDDTKAGQKQELDWNVRYRIAVGVARAIAYLHEECLEWVLHCDIKPENILLEDDFCPKVSDFGLAKMAKKEDDNLSRSMIRGSPGYMAPEWVNKFLNNDLATSDAITAKADVYSYGKVLLELVTGVRNSESTESTVESAEFYYPKWAFEKVYIEKKVEDILDRRIIYCYDHRRNSDMVERMVKTAMWCLQDKPESRPSMGKVAKMLEGTVEITDPHKPTIFYLSDN